MTPHDPNDDAIKLPDEEARRLLARASELELRSDDLSVAQLREAALEALIAPNAFDQAVVELRTPAEQAITNPEKPSRWRAGLLSTAKTVLIVLGTLFAIMLLVDFL